MIFLNFLKYIRGGINASTTFSYDDYEVRLRPLSSYELDLAEEEGLKVVDSKVAQLIMRIRLHETKLTEKLKEFPPEMFRNINKFYKTVDYWIVYYSMKDFQPPNFSIEDVKQMKYIHGMAKTILNISSIKKHDLVRVLSNRDGERLLTMIYKYHVPLTDAAWKLTPMQEKIYELGLDEGKVYAESMDDIDRKLYGKPLREVLKEIERSRQ